MAFMVKGDQVSFLDEHDREIVLPETHVLVHDVLGEMPGIRRCDFYVITWVRGREGLSSSDLLMKKEFVDYYGHENAMQISIEVPKRGWKTETTVKAIRYRRTGKAEGLYEHLYAEPQPLFRAGPRGRKSAWRVSTPDHCIATWRGLVYP